MGKPKPVEFGNYRFENQKKAIEFVHNIIEEIGFCKSVKEKSPQYYETLLCLLYRHPESDIKLKDIIDLCIKPNMNGDKEIQIVKSDETNQDISWRIAIRGTGNTILTNLKSAMRYSIIPQVQFYRYQNQNENCTDQNCENKSHDLDIDHVNYFDCLVENFLRTVNDYTLTFNDAPDGSNRSCFKNEDKDWEVKWQSYHQKHAILTTLCKPCNQERKKYKKGSVIL